MSFLNSKVLWQSLTILRHTKMQPTQKARSCVSSQISKPNKMTFRKIFEKKIWKCLIKKWKNFKSEKIELLKRIDFWKDGAGGTPHFFSSLKFCSLPQISSFWFRFVFFSFVPRLFWIKILNLFFFWDKAVMANSSSLARCGSISCSSFKVRACLGAIFHIVSVVS